MDGSAMKKKFYEDINKREQKANSFKMSSTKYSKLIEDVKKAKSGTSKENRHYWLLRHYDVVTVDQVEKLIAPKVKDQVLYYVVLDELFDVLYDTHASIGHIGRDRMRHAINQRYKNITGQDIQTFLNLCEPCLQKRNCEKKKYTGKPMIYLHLHERCQVDLIDYQSRADGEFNYIMFYQDHLTKFVILRALKTKQVDEVVEQLLDIFLLFGAPSILQSDNNCGDFVNNIIEEIKKMWPEIKIVPGKPRHSHLQASVDLTIQDIENKLNTWMQKQKCNNWSKGLGFVQFMKNKVLHSGIKRSPYQAMFGQPVKIGYTSSSLSKDIIKDIKTEKDLEKALIEQDYASQNSQVQENDTPEYVKLEDGLQEDILKLEDTAIIKQELLEDVLQNENTDGEKEILHLERFCKTCEASFCPLNDTEVCETCSLWINKKSSGEVEENLENQAKRIKIISDASTTIL